MDAVEHGNVVLAAILMGRGSVKALNIAQRSLRPAHFADSLQQNLYEWVVDHFSNTTGVMTYANLDDRLRDQPVGTLQLYRSFWNQLPPYAPGSIPAFRHSINELQALYAARQTGEALAEGREILTIGAKHGRDLLQGHQDARAHVSARFADIERDLHAATAPDGDMRTESMDILSTYARHFEARKSGKSRGVATGLSTLDAMLGGGLQPGELCLIAGFTTVGKTSLCCQIAWHAVTQLGLDVVFFTTETLRVQVRTKILARHSRLPQFGLGLGLNSRDIKAGSLEGGQAVLGHVVDDFTTNPAYGHAYIAQCPPGASVATLDQRLQVLARQWPAQLVIIDYLALLQPVVRTRRQQREELSEIVKAAKILATSYENGAGVPVISPWQTSRDGWEKALARKPLPHYTLAELGETHEASATPDAIMALIEAELAPDNTQGRRVKLRAQMLKNRDGERDAGTSSVLAEVDYATCCFTPLQDYDRPAIGVSDPFG